MMASVFWSFQNLFVYLETGLFDEESTNLRGILGNFLSQPGVVMFYASFRQVMSPDFREFADRYLPAGFDLSAAPELSHIHQGPIRPE